MVSYKPVVEKSACIGAIKNNVVIIEIIVSTIEANIAQRGYFSGLNKYNPTAAITKSMEGI